MRKDELIHNITFFNRFRELFGFQIPSHFLLPQTSSNRATFLNSALLIL